MTIKFHWKTRRVQRNGSHENGKRYSVMAMLQPGQRFIIEGMPRTRGQALAADWRNRYPNRDYRAITIADGVLIERVA